MVKHAINIFCFLFNVALSALLLYLLWSSRLPLAKDGQGIEYKDFISILLTALAVMIAAATILLATAAIWGFTALREEARSSAEKEASRVARDIAESVATRTARETKPTDTSPAEAEKIADAMKEGGSDGL
jgi:hypothetical protein